MKKNPLNTKAPSRHMFIATTDEQLACQPAPRTGRKMSKAKIAAYVDSLPDEHFRHQSIYGHQSPLQQIFGLCLGIIKEDTHFQNKTWEIERAKTVAASIQERFDKIKKLTLEVPEDQASLALTMLAMLDYPWMRVLGDQMRELEKEMKTYYFTCEHLLLKARRHSVKQSLISRNIPEDGDPADYIGWC